jgi:hypothetical protein
MKFIAHASQFGLKKTLRQLFTFGFSHDSKKLKAYIADRYQVKAENVALYGSGRTALSEAIKYFTKPGDKVAITALTCFAVVEAIRSAGCEPVYLDVNLKNLHFNAKNLEKGCAKNPDIKAVIVQNNLAYPCDIVNIESVAKKYNLALIEDLAHCVGMDYPDGREAGTVGDAVIMSFGKGKSLDLISGGLLFLRKTDKRKKSFTIPTNLPSFADRFRTRLYPLFGAITRALFHLQLGCLNFGRLYTAFLLKTHQIQKSADAKLDSSIRLPHWQAKLALRDLKKIKHRTPLRRFYFVENREELLAKLTAAGFIMDDIWYSSPVSPERYYTRANFNEKACPNAVFAANHLINLPNWLNIFELAEARHLINQYEVNLEGEKIASFTTKKSLSETEVEQIDALRHAASHTNFLQSKQWYEVNKSIGHKPIFLMFSEKSYCLAIIKDAKRGRFLEIPCGPILDYQNRNELELAMAEIYRYAKQNNCVFVRFRPNLEETPENRALIESIPSLSASYFLHAENTVFVDLTQSEEDLLKNMRRQTRYEVRRSEKLKFKVKKSNTPEILREFHQIQAETAKRQGFIPPRRKDLNAYAKAFGSDLQIYRATLDGKPVAYGLVLTDALEGDYFEAASTELNYKFPGAYALQWYVMRDLKKQGKLRYNLWGIAPAGQKNHKFAGVTTFKTGFGGEKFDYLHAHDLPVKKLHYGLIRLVEDARRKKRHL